MLVVAMFAAGSLSAQMMRLHMKDGNVNEFKYSDVDSLVIVPADNSPKFDIEISDLGAARMTVTVACADPTVRYFFDLCTAAVYEKRKGDMAGLIHDYIDEIRAQYPQLTLDQVLDAMLDSGVTSDVIRKLPADTDMYIYAMAVGDDGVCYGKPEVKAFHTLAAGNPADCTFEVTANNVTSDGCTVSIVPSDPSIAYWYGICAVAQYPGDFAITADVQQAVAELADANGMTVSDVVNRIAYSDDISQAESGLERSTPYYIYVYALNPDASAAGAVTKTRFTTTDYDLSNAAVSLSYRYFDGDALCKVDAERYAKYKGRVMVEARVTPNEEAAHWVVALGAKDMTDEVTYPDESTKSAVLQVGFTDRESMTFAADWGVATFLYFGADFAGVDGPLRRLKADFQPAGASPVAALESDASAKVKARMPQRVDSFRKRF